jgi:hypothetical protein
LKAENTDAGDIAIVSKESIERDYCKLCYNKNLEWILIDEDMPGLSKKIK